MNVRILDRVGLRPQLEGNEKRVSGIAPPRRVSFAPFGLSSILNRPFFTLVHRTGRLPDDFQCELNLPRCGRCRSQSSRATVPSAC
jgi:hypothetical protein